MWYQRRALQLPVQQLPGQQPLCLWTHQWLARPMRVDLQDYRVGKRNQSPKPTMRLLETFVESMNADRFDACLFYSPRFTTMLFRREFDL